MQGSGPLLLIHNTAWTLMKRVRPTLHRLGGKSVNTLRKRISSATKYVAWCCEQGTCAFPIDADVVVNYTAKSGGVGATFSSISSFLETCRFLHVLGVDMRDNAVSNPVVQGRIRAARLTRPPRRLTRQSQLRKQMAEKKARTAVAVRAAAPVARPPVARIWMMSCRLPRTVFNQAS